MGQKKETVIVVVLMAFMACKNGKVPQADEKAEVQKPVVISTWNHGVPANEVAWEILKTRR